MKKLANAFLIILIIGGFIIYNKTNTKSTYTITPDTNVSKVKGLSKYVTQEEVDDFSFRYWDIDSNYTKNIPSNLIPLRTYLKQKDTNKVLNYIKDNNLSVDIKIQDNTTPLMYSSFYNDLNTSNKLINLGANIRAKDRYGLSPLAYAIENNSTKTVKLLLDRGVRFEEIDKVQWYLKTHFYTQIGKLTIDENNNTTVYYKDKIDEKDTGSKDGVYFINYLKTHRYIDIFKMALDSGYKPKRMTHKRTLPGLADEHNLADFRVIVNAPNYKPLLELLLKYNVYGKPTKEELKRAYEYCYEEYKRRKEHYKQVLEKDRQELKKKRQIYNLIAIVSKLKNSQKYCKDINGTFTMREYFNWANEAERLQKINDFSWDNPDKVFYTQSNSTKEINSTNKK